MTRTLVRFERICVDAEPTQAPLTISSPTSFWSCGGGWEMYPVHVSVADRASSGSAWSPCLLKDSRGGDDTVAVVPAELIASLRAAVDAAPDDVALRIHFARLLAETGERDEAVRQAAAVLQQDPENADALSLIAGSAASTAPSSDGDVKGSVGADPVADREETIRRLEAELDGVVPPRFVGPEEIESASAEVEEAGIRLSDVGGMADVKARLETAVLAPLRNPELVRLYGKSVRGGLLMYGPPGCGKTFIARALAGEMGAGFLPVSLADVLDMYIGQSERNVHEVFETARRCAPCVVFLDEVDALGQKRSQMRHSAARSTVNQLLSEMDGIAADNDGVYVLGATNHPWDVDVALRRPGRFDRMVLVLPPDEPAREEILRFHLRDRPIENVDVSRLAKATEGYSGADLAFVCESAAERALLDSATTGSARMINMTDLLASVKDIRPSIGPWLETARNVAQFANEGGAYDDLLVYLRARRLA